MCEGFDEGRYIAEAEQAHEDEQAAQAQYDYEQGLAAQAQADAEAERHQHRFLIFLRGLIAKYGGDAKVKTVIEKEGATNAENAGGN